MQCVTRHFNVVKTNTLCEINICHGVRCAAGMLPLNVSPRVEVERKCRYN